MKRTDEELKNSNKYICDNIERIKPDDIDFYSSNILKDLRDFVEIIAVKLSGEEYYSYQIFKKIENNIFSKGQYKFLKEFHQLLQKSMSHYTEVGENATRLIFKYYEYLLKIKKLMKDKYDIDVLGGLEKIENIINEDKDLKEYYEKVSKVINTSTFYKKSLQFNEVYYIDKIKPFFINQEIFYEISFRLANDYTSKFDRIIAFTKKEIMPNYAVKFSIEEDYIELYNKLIPIKIITDYEIHIRPCEFNNFSYIIFGTIGNISTKNREYHNLMNFMKNKNLNLLDIVTLKDREYTLFQLYLANNSKTIYIKNLLNKCRDIIEKSLPGANVLKYLLYTMNNNIIKKMWGKKNDILSNLYLKYGVIPFEKIPYSFFPPNHTPRFMDIFHSIGDLENREDELFARFIRNNSEIKGMLYTSEKDIKTFKDIENLIDKYNNKLYKKHRPQANLVKEKNQIYIYGYEKDTIEILKKIENLSKEGIKGYSESINSWLKERENFIDDPDKEKALIHMFENSKVTLIYGSAGTGKTKLIEYITQFFKDRTKNINMLFLANTHTAVNNLKRRIGNISNTTFGTVKKFSNKKLNTDILIIDECSTISNNDMLTILKNIEFELLVLVGDIYQIDSIRFGNWFYLLKKFYPKIVTELKETRRTKNKQLLDFWNAVRNLDNDITEKIVRNNYATSLNESIFKREDEDEIILCLNYNGLYGINNINMLLQQANPNPEEKWGVYTFKVGDPILFNEIDRKGFDGIIYNNLKGIIRKIDYEYKGGIKEKIIFEVEIEDVLNEFDVVNSDIKLVDTKENSSIIRFYVKRIHSTDEDSNELKDDIIPFQIAYALSIHKAQGLEYNSVKIVITDEVEEQITHNIFYTAITRAKEKLKIYWSPQTQKKILSRLQHKFNDKDFYILKNKLNKGVTNEQKFESIKFN